MGVEQGALIDAVMTVFSESTHQMDQYCERLDLSFWGEPINAVSNFCIIFAGFMILRLYYRDVYARHQRHYLSFWALSLTVIALGVGSLLWHTFATGWALWADLAPIIVLIFMYQWAVLRKVFRWNVKETRFYMVLFILFNAWLISTFGQEALNGSVIYVPSVAALIWFGVKMKREKKRGSNYMLMGVFIFLSAVVFRTMDMAVCEWVPIGTHFMWHVCNSILVYFLAKALILGYVGFVRPDRKVTRRGYTM